MTEPISLRIKDTPVQVEAAKGDSPKTGEQSKAAETPKPAAQQKPAEPEKHESHGHAEDLAVHEHGETWLGAAAVEGVAYAILVYLAATFASWPIDFRPSVGNGEMIAITSMIIPLLWIFVFARFHKILQKGLCKYGPRASGSVFLIDASTSILPGLALLVALLVDWFRAPPSYHYYSWSIWYLIFITLMVGDSVVEDFLALRRYRR